MMERQAVHGLTVISEVTNSSNEVKPKPKTLAFVAVSFFKNAKDFKVTNDMLNRDTQTSEFTIGFLVCFAERLFGWFTLGCFRVRVKVLQSLVTSVA
jgi:hypothetical protein